MDVTLPVGNLSVIRFVPVNEYKERPREKTGFLVYHVEGIGHRLETQVLGLPKREGRLGH